MNFRTRITRGALLAITVALAVSAVPMAGGSADAAAPTKSAILTISAIL